MIAGEVLGEADAIPRMESHGLGGSGKQTDGFGEGNLLVILILA